MNDNRPHICKAVFNVFVLIFFTVFVIGVVKRLHFGQPVSFSSFLNWLGQVDGFQISVDISAFKITQGWGLFDGLRIFFNSLGTIIGCVVWFGANVLNIITFLGQFIIFLFA